MGRDGYSNFGFYNAIPSDIYSAAITGRTIDMRGFDTITFMVNAHSLASGGALSADNVYRLILQHGLASDAGVSTWSLVPLSQIIHSVEGGYDSTASDGVWQSLETATQALSTDIYAVGYKKDVLHRYIRLYVSVCGAPSTLWLGAIAKAGLPGDWPVNEPV
jgi:hypothetical protein